MTLKPVDILMVEDNLADVELTRIALRRAKVELKDRLSVVGDGEEAMLFLRREGKHAGARRPDIILLDLNLPGKSGREVLAEIKQDPDLCTIPVVILTSSDAEADILRSYKLHANAYVKKPLGLQQLDTIVQTLHSFWFTVVTLPPKG